MVTTILAIYGAAVSTTSVFLSIWFFKAAGPRLQAQATFEPPVLFQDESEENETRDRTLMLKVWNAGRHPVKVDLGGLTVRHGSSSETYIPMNWQGPDLPIWIPGHSGEEWWETVSNLHGLVVGSIETNEMSIELIEAGNREREVKIPLSNWRTALDPVIIYRSVVDPETYS